MEQHDFCGEGVLARQDRKNSPRINRHTDYSKAVPAKDEADLFALLDKLKEPPFLLILDTVQVRIIWGPVYERLMRPVFIV